MVRFILAISVLALSACAAIPRPDPQTQLATVQLACPSGVVVLSVYQHPDGYRLYAYGYEGQSPVLWARVYPDGTVKDIVYVNGSGKVEKLTIDELNRRFPSPCALPRDA